MIRKKGGGSLNYCIAQNAIIKLILDVIITLWILIFHTHSCFVAWTISICLLQLTKALMRFQSMYVCVRMSVTLRGIALACLCVCVWILMCAVLAVWRTCPQIHSLHLLKGFLSWKAFFTSTFGWSNSASMRAWTLRKRWKSSHFLMTKGWGISAVPREVHYSQSQL